MLADLALVEVLYRRSSPIVSDHEWQQVLNQIEAGRSLVEKENITLYGETTALAVDAGGAQEALMLAASRERGDRSDFETGLPPTEPLLGSELNPDLGDGSAVLFNIPKASPATRDYYAVSAGNPDRVLTLVLPEIDAAIKNLRNQAVYFSHQRLTIADERAQIDTKVGGLLHERVVRVIDEPEGAGHLEEMIASLSRMFGLLATDSLLVRRSEDNLKMRKQALESVLNLNLNRKSGARDEIGPYCLQAAASDLEEVHAEGKKLELSRQNAAAAIEVVRTQVELLRTREEAVIQEQTKELLSRSLLVQQERLSLQVAAGLVEFVLIFYYVLKSWEGIAGQAVVDRAPAIIRLLAIGGMSAGAAIGTHFLAQALYNRSWKSAGLWISAVVLAASIAAMLVLTLVEQHG